MLSRREGRNDELGQKLEGVDAMQLTCSDDAEQASGKTFADLGLRSKADFPPLHGKHDNMFGAIVCGLDSFMFEKEK